MSSSRTLFLLVATVTPVVSGASGAACASVGGRPRATSESDPQRLEAAVGDRLRALFPEIEGEITRASIRAALRREQAAGDPLREAAIQAFDAGDDRRARGLIGELLAGNSLARARALLAAGDPRAALAALDAAAEVAPQTSEIRLLRAETALAVGEVEGEPALFESALAGFLAVATGEPGAEAWLGASRAARRLGRGAEALEYARRGVSAVQAPAAAPPLRMLPTGQPERTLAEACLDVYDGARAAGAPEDVATRWRESRDALEGLIGRAPEDPWAWERLAYLHESSGSFDEAQAIARRGLALAPEDEGLHRRLASAAQAAGGHAAVIRVFDEFSRAHPDVGLATWHSAVARFEDALDRLQAGADARDLFAAAEAGFARCRKLLPGHDRACREKEALCRGGAGWCALGAEDLEGARAAFLSMEDVRPGSLAFGIEGRLTSGVLGLDRIGVVYKRRIEGDPNSLSHLEDLERASRIYDYLHEYQPGDARWAESSGFFARDIAVALELKASALCVQGKDEEAGLLLSRAREHMEKSFRSYVDAAALAPDDARILNDAGQILTGYLQREIQRAEGLLLRAVALAEAQAGSLHGPALERVRTALGDACQNLGVLHLTLKGDPDVARVWFEKSLETDPEGRVEVEHRLVLCRKAIEEGARTLVDETTRWATPCRSRKPR